MVMKLLSNPSFLNLEAKYEFYFEDKNGKPYTETEVWKEDQEIHFCISFTVVAGEIKKSSNTNGNRKDFQYFLPKLLSTIPCIRDSKEYYCKGKKWQYYLEIKENIDLWIYIQLLEIYRKNFDTKYEVKAYGTHRECK
uniref:Uncharacterized protein n=1 Tax=Panagrolaimus davidi TaxID=227884 RepID=A0A914Q541_9BILA